MWQFIISGYVPGTDIQITFDTIASIAGLFLVAALLDLLIMQRRSMEQEILRSMRKIHDFRKWSI